VSVARAARKYGVNANQVFYWLRLYQGGQSQGGLTYMEFVCLQPQKQHRLSELKRQSRMALHSPALPATHRPNLRYS
jgi:transposase-like protein